MVVFALPHKAKQSSAYCSMGAADVISAIGCMLIAYGSLRLSCRKEAIREGDGVHDRKPPKLSLHSAVDHFQ